MKKLALILSALVLLIASPAAAAKEAPKTFTYTGKVVSVYDGDTFRIFIDGWPAPFNPIGVRLDYIDTPESKMPPAKKACEVVRGKAASRYMKKTLHVGETVTVLWTEGRHDKYGRLLARVVLKDGRDLAQLMIQSGNARPYDGGTKKPWC